MASAIAPPPRFLCHPSDVNCEAIADPILDQIINSSYKILLEGTSMREEYSKLK